MSRGLLTDGLEGLEQTEACEFATPLVFVVSSLQHKLRL